MAINWFLLTRVEGKSFSIPTYGNYGGPFYSGGQIVEPGRDVDLTVEPVDALDRLFRDHDIVYQETQDLGQEQQYLERAEADLELIRRIQSLSLADLVTEDAFTFAGLVILIFIDQIENKYEQRDLLDPAERESLVETVFIDLAIGLAVGFAQPVETRADLIGLAVWALGLSSGWVGNVAGNFAQAIEEALRRLCEPMVVDLDGDGIELLARAEGNVHFDMDRDGIREWTGWVKPDDGLLAIDDNGNGRIDDIGELIGDQVTTGFTELLPLDINGDRVLNAADLVWSRLLVWRDLDQDGVSDPGELRSIAATGIAAIDLRYTTVNFTAEGNQIHEQSTFEWADGRVGTVVDAWFEVDNVATARTTVITADPTIDALPDIPGYGDVAPIRAAMAIDGALTSLVAAAVALRLDQLAGVRGSIETILYRWAGTLDIATDSRGPEFDGRQLATLEAFLGTPFLARGVTDPNAAAARDLEQAWTNLVDGIAARLLLAGPFRNVLETSTYLPVADQVLTVEDLAGLIEQAQAGAPTSSTIVIADYWAAAIPLIRAVAAEQGVDTLSTDYAGAIAQALAPLGLSAFAALIDDGVAQVTLPPSGILSSNGLFRLSSGADTVYLTGSLQALFGIGGNDRLSVISTSSRDQFHLDGGAGADTILGGEGADWLNGGPGADAMYGVGGNDTYTVDDPGDLVVEANNDGEDWVRSSVEFVLPDRVEHLLFLGNTDLGGTGNDVANHVIGNDGNNRLQGLDGDDVLDGGSGADRLEGGAGGDLYKVDAAGDRVVETGTDWDTIEATISIVMPRLVEELILLGEKPLNGSGNALDNYLTGNALGNVLDGRLGADRMWGGKGDDVYFVDNSNDRPTELLDEGNDSVRSSVSFTIGAHFERLYLLSENDINGGGNDLANFLYGNSGNNVLNGGEGPDQMIGGAGDDGYFVDHVGDVVQELVDGGRDWVATDLVAYTLPVDVGDLWLYTSSRDRVVRDGTGNDLSNTIYGTDAANRIDGVLGDDALNGFDGGDTLFGRGGDDRLDGGEGADRMEGGAGNDIYDVDDAGDVVLEAASAGYDRVVTSVSFLLTPNLEELELIGSERIDAAGNGLANRILGNQANNVLDGGGGADLMIGGAGDDTYVVDSIGDIVVEAPGEGTDLVRSSVSYTLGVGVNNLFLLGTGPLTANGNQYANAITGNAGNNVISGGLDADTLRGEAGADRFVWRDLIEFGWSTSTVDEVKDFNFFAGDRLDLSGIDADATVTGEQDFTFVGTAEFLAAGQINYYESNNVTWLAMNVDADSSADAYLGLTGSHSVEQNWFV